MPRKRTKPQYYMSNVCVKRGSAVAFRILTTVVLGAGAWDMDAKELQSESERYIHAVRTFADAVLEHGRDMYGPEHTPLFADGLHVETLEPVRWKKDGQMWVLCNFASQQTLLRLLDGLTTLSGEPRYREAAEAAARYALRHLRAPNGLLYWGGHMAWDLEHERPVGEYANVHEMKNHQPWFSFLWRVDAAETRRLVEAIWGGHVLNWSLLDYNRHAATDKPAPARWDHLFIEETPVPFPSVGNNLSFALTTPSLLEAGVALALADGHTNALAWTRRLVWRWQQARDPVTGLSGGQLSYRKQDRAQEALGHVHPHINEARMVAAYHRTTRYHHLPLAQMQAGEMLVAAGGRPAEIGREFIRWASDDLKTYARHCWQPGSGEFVSLLTDGTSIQWQKARRGYYNSNSFAPAKPDGWILWGHALAWRLTGDRAHEEMAGQLAAALGLAEAGGAARDPWRLQFDTTSEDWRHIYALLELGRASGDRRFLRLAARVADNCLKRQTRTGLFPRFGRAYARTSDEVPLAILHIAAALQGRENALPQALLDNGYFHCQHDAVAARSKSDVGDNRTYDRDVYYGER
jgi:pectate lyase